MDIDEDSELPSKPTSERAESRTRYLGTPPKSHIQVILHTPSRTWIPSQPRILVPEYPPADDEDQSSEFSLTQYGPLDWDHSGDELGEEEVTPRITRRMSTASQTSPQELSVFDPDPQKSTAASARGRDKNGRFISANATPAPKTKRLWRSVRASRRKSKYGHDAMGFFNGNRQETPEGNAEGRIRAKSEPPPILPPKKILQPSADTLAEPEPQYEEQMVGKPAKTKRLPTKSRYFSPATTPVKPKALKRDTTRPPGEATGAGSSTSLPQTPRTPREGTPIGSSPRSSRTPGGIVSCIPFPPLSSPTFGLIQEKLASDPFRLLIAVTFLIRTHGKHAIPVFFELMEKYPTPESLATANKDEIMPIIRHLGLQNQRAGTYQTYAQIWLADPPVKDRRYSVRGYPTKDSGRNVGKDEIILDSDEREAWEIGHMTSGPYALDSWRIFCRDKLRGVAEGWNGEGTEEGFQPEWMKVLPEDKELRAFLRWMWLKEGFEWDPFTGEKEVAREELMRAAIGGRIAWDDRGGMRIIDVEDLAADLQ